MNILDKDFISSEMDKQSSIFKDTVKLGREAEKVNSNFKIKQKTRIGHIEDKMHIKKSEFEKIKKDL